MAFSKKHLYPLDRQRLSEFCKALAYPGRLEILDTLWHHGTLTVKELHQHHPITEETFSDHLFILRKAGLIEAEERYPNTYYSVQETTLEFAILLLNAYISIFQKKPEHHTSC